MAVQGSYNTTEPRISSRPTAPIAVLKRGSFGACTGDIASNTPISNSQARPNGR